MITEEKKICPKCGRNYTEVPAISREDNKTEICPECGQGEAMMDFMFYRFMPKNKKGVKNGRTIRSKEKM